MSPSTRVAIIAVALFVAACSQRPYPPERVEPAAGASAAQAAALPASAPAASAPAAAAPAPAPAPAEPSTAALPPPASQPAQVAAAQTESAGTGGSWTSTYPYGTATTDTSPTTATGAASGAPAPAEPRGELLARATDTGSGEGITVFSAEDEAPLQPFVSGWYKEGADSEQRRADIEACYRFAFSQVEHDIRIDSDVAAARDDEDKGLGITKLTQRMNVYDLKSRRTSLINDCMESKGYVQN